MATLIDSPVALRVDDLEVGTGAVLAWACLRLGPRHLAASLVDDLLIHRAVAAAGIAPDEAAIARELARVRTRAGVADENGSASADAEAVWLQDQGIEAADLHRLARHRVAVAALRRRIAAPRCEAYFEANRAWFDAVELTHLQIRAAQDAEATLARAVRALELGVGTTERIPRRTLPVALATAVFGAHPGEVVGPFGEGAVCQVARIEAFHPATLDDAVRSEIETLLFAEWLGGERQRARIEVRLGEVLPDPPALPGIDIGAGAG